MKENLIFQGKNATVNFYPAAFEGKTFEQFAEHEKNCGLDAAELKEVYELYNNPPKKEEAKKEEAKKERK